MTVWLIAKFIVLYYLPVVNNNLFKFEFTVIVVMNGHKQSHVIRKRDLHVIYTTYD